MKSTFKLIRRFIKVLLLSFIGLMLLNIALFIFVVSRSESNSGGWKAAEQLGNERTLPFRVCTIASPPKTAVVNGILAVV